MRKSGVTPLPRKSHSIDIECLEQYMINGSRGKVLESIALTILLRGTLSSSASREVEISFIPVYFEIIR
jgi:hypothetical protein